MSEEIKVTVQTVMILAVVVALFLEFIENQ
jgi:hypothetical protein